MAMLNKRASQDLDEQDSQEDNKEDGPKEDDATQDIESEEPETDPREALMAMLNKRAATTAATEGEVDEDEFFEAEEAHTDAPQDKQEEEEQKDEDEPLEPPREGGCNQS